MATSDLINLIAGILVGGGTLTLAVMTWKSIRQTRSIQKAEKRQRLLNEIIEWATDIRRNSSESISPNKIVFDTPMEQEATQRDFYSLRLKYQTINVKSDYIKELAKVFGNKLLFATEKVIQQLGEIIMTLENYITSKRSNEKSEELEGYKEQLDICARDLIAGATKIKTRDIIKKERNK